MYVVYTNELQHHGIKGQKWGVRRFQNPDGSYTVLGREHYGIGSKFGDRRQPDDLVRKTIPAGSTFYRLQAKNADKLGNVNGGVYVYNQRDKHNLRSIVPWIADTQFIEESDIEEIKMKTNRPLKVASLKDVEDVMEQSFHNKEIREYLEGVEFFNWLNGTSLSCEEMEKLPKEEIASKIQKASQEQLAKLEKPKVSFLTKILDPEYYKTKMFSYESKKQRYERQIAESINKAENLKKSIKLTTDAMKHFGDQDIDDINLRNKITSIKDSLTSKSAYSVPYQQFIYDKIREAGFDAIYDNNMIDAGLNRTQEAHEPLIILDNKSLNIVGRTDNIDVNKSNDKWEDYRMKVSAKESAMYYQDIIKNYKAVNGTEIPDDLRERYQKIIDNSLARYNSITL